MSRGRLSLGLLVLALAMAALVIATRESCEQPEGSNATTDDATQAAQNPRRASRSQPHAKRADPRISPSRAPRKAAAAATADDQPTAGGYTKHAHESYLRWARYPPSSRPLAERIDRIKPHSVSPTQRPLEVDPPGQVQIRLTQSQMFLAGGDGAIVTVEAARGEDPVSLQIKRAVITAAGLDAGADVLAEITFRDDGEGPDAEANDGKLSALLSTEGTPLQSMRGRVRLVIEVSAAGESGSVDAIFKLTGAPPARFTGKVREAIEEGSLALYAEVEVIDGGQYEIAGRVFSHDDKPIAFVTKKTWLEAGSSEVRLLVFGKILVDLEATMPLELRNLEGWRWAEEGSPDRAYMAIWQGPHETAKYPPDVLSADEWDSPEKQRRQELLDNRGQP